MGVFENEKRLRKDKKFEEKETRGDFFRKKLKEVDKNRDRRKKTDILEIRSSKPKGLEVEKSLENLQKDFRFPRKRKRMPEGSGKGETENPPKRKIGEQKEMIPLAKGGRAMLRGGGICKRGMNKKAVGKNS